MTASGWKRTISHRPAHSIGAATLPPRIPPPILLLSSFSIGDEKDPAIMRSEARFALEGVHVRAQVAMQVLLGALRGRALQFLDFFDTKRSVTAPIIGSLAAPYSVGRFTRMWPGTKLSAR